MLFSLFLSIEAAKDPKWLVLQVLIIQGVWMTRKSHQIIQTLLIISLGIGLHDPPIGTRFERILFEILNKLCLLLGT